MAEQSRLSAYDGAEVHQSPVYALVGCGADKTDGDHEAADLYVSPYFTAKQRFAELVADSWWIVSAEYRLVASDDQIRDYDMDVREIDVGLWLDDIPDTLDRYWDAPRRLWVLAGEAYLSAADKRGPDPGARGKPGCHRRRCLLPVPSNAENRRPAPVVPAMY